MAVTAKRIRLSDDSGSNWYTMPGNAGAINNEAGQLDDTVFGQNWSSIQSALIGWSVSANGLYKGFAGYVATIKEAGTTTSMTAEAASLVSGKTYQIDDITKRVLDIDTAVVVDDSAAPVSAADIESIDYLHGRVTFASTYTPSGAVTFDCNYFPMVALGTSRSFSLNMTAEAIDDTDMPTAQANSGHRTFTQGLRTVAFDLSGVYALSNGYRASLLARDKVLIEIVPDGNSKSIARGWFMPTTQGQSGNVGALEEETINYALFVPDVADMERPFGWHHASDTTLSQSLQVMLTAFEDGSEIDVQYLPDGTTGVTGAGIITEASLSGGLEAMNDFSMSFQGSGAIAAVP